MFFSFLNFAPVNVCYMSSSAFAYPILRKVEHVYRRDGAEVCRKTRWMEPVYPWKWGQLIFVSCESWTDIQGGPLLFALYFPGEDFFCYSIIILSLWLIGTHWKSLLGDLWPSQRLSCCIFDTSHLHKAHLCACMARILFSLPYSWTFLRHISPHALYLEHNSITEDLWDNVFSYLRGWWMNSLNLKW